MSKGKNIQNTIVKNILRGSFTATVWIFELLINMGIMTMEAFLNPSLYKEPVYFSFESIDTKNSRKKAKNKPSEIAIRQSIWRLKKAGFVEKKGNFFFLTEKGKKLAGYILSRKKIFDKKWDGKFRIVIFDIPEKSRKDRNWLRQELYFLKYRKLQESVFIGKHPLPQDLIKDIKQKKMGNFVNYILADKIYKNIFDK
jgi:hypothetical protein